MIYETPGPRLVMAGLHDRRDRDAGDGGGGGVAGLAEEVMHLRAIHQEGVDHPRPQDPPEVALWGEVVARAVGDLGMWFYADKYSRRVSRMAARWLFSPIYAKDYQLACEYAGLCPERTREIAKRKWLSVVPLDWTTVQNALWKEVVKC